MINQLTVAAGQSPTNRQHFWDFFIDEQPLRATLRAGDMVPILVHSWPTGLSNDVFVLLHEQPPALPSGRVPLFVCPECGDLDCGAITAAVQWSTDTVTWFDFGWEVSYEQDDGGDDRLEAGPFTFHRVQYEAELRRFITTFD